MSAAMRRLRIAQVAPPLERVPPAAYGGTERVVDELTRQLVDRGHEVTVFASGDSDVAGRLVPTVDRALRPAGIESDASGWFATTVKMVIEQAADFDVIHSHLEWWSIPLARLSPVPAVATFHGRLDLPWADRLLGDAPDGMVAISRHQASTHPSVPWTIIHNGLTLDRAPFREQPGDSFCFVGRVDAEKGIIEAIDIALRAGRHLRIAAKVGNLARQRDYYESVFRPALQRAGRSVEYLGELQPAERDQLFAESYATLMPGAWPEPFGLVSIESLACGTPVLARRVGALPEIIREGVDGYFGDDAVAMAFFADRLGTLDRREIRERVIERFSAARMADRYEELYLRMIAVAGRAAGSREHPDAAEVEEALAVQLPVQVTEPSDTELPEKEDGALPPEAADAATVPEVIALPGPGEPMEVAAEAGNEPVEAAAEAAEEPVELAADAPEEPVEAVAETESEPMEVAADAEAEPVAALAEAEGEPVEAVAETVDAIEILEEPGESVGASDAETAEEPEPVAGAAWYADFGGKPAEDDGREEPGPAAAMAVEAALVDVVVEDSGDDTPVAVSEDLAEPEPEPEPEPTAEPEPVAEAAPAAGPVADAESRADEVAEAEPIEAESGLPTLAVEAAAAEAPAAEAPAAEAPAYVVGGDGVLPPALGHPAGDSIPQLLLRALQDAVHRARHAAGQRAGIRLDACAAAKLGGDEF